MAKQHRTPDTLIDTDHNMLAADVPVILIHTKSGTRGFKPHMTLTSTRTWKLHLPFALSAFKRLQIDYMPDNTGIELCFSCTCKSRPR